MSILNIPPPDRNPRRTRRDLPEDFAPDFEQQAPPQRSQQRPAYPYNPPAAPPSRAFQPAYTPDQYDPQYEADIYLPEDQPQPPAPRQQYSRPSQPIYRQPADPSADLPPGRERLRAARSPLPDLDSDASRPSIQRAAAPIPIAQRQPLPDLAPNPERQSRLRAFLPAEPIADYAPEPAYSEPEYAPAFEAAYEPEYAPEPPVAPPPSSSYSDAFVLERLHAGDPQALAALYDRYARIVYSVALRVLRDPSAAEDILAELFLALWRKPALYNTARGPLGPWMVVTARNRSIEAIRRLPATNSSELILASPYDLSDEAERNFLVEKSRQAAYLLPPAQRKTLEMAFFDGLTHAEIAEMTGEPIATVKSRIRSALLSLRQELES